ncbi:membrane protein [Geodermatophilus saharensis]|uniref:Membrane protein n=1 Tax=Geodermatophilus saharensis TaxID=1137994 RepID=A0A238ZW44_9ACTN|nr:membrane protein [Geodermatophilus saharensis]
MWGQVARLGPGATARVDRLRRRAPWFDHLARAGGRYTRTQGDLMAAGVTYFVFLGLFPVLLLVASGIALVLSGDALLQQELYGAIREAFPGSTGEQIVGELRSAVDAAGLTGLIGAVGVVYAGLRAMDKLRIGMELIWKGRADEPEFWRDNLQDLVALVLLGVVGLVSLTLTGVGTRATAWFLDLLGLEGVPGLGVLTSVLGLALALLTDVLVFLWLLRVVPSTSSPLRRLLPGALFGAAGLEVLKLAGTLYLSLIGGSVTASAFGGAVGILVWINLVARFAFFTAAWTASLPSLTSAASAAPAGPVPVPAGSGARPAARR